MRRESVSQFEVQTSCAVTFGIYDLTNWRWYVKFEFSDGKSRIAIFSDTGISYYNGSPWQYLWSK